MSLQSHKANLCHDGRPNWRIGKGSTGKNADVRAPEAFHPQCGSCKEAQGHRLACSDIHYEPRDNIAKLSWPCTKSMTSSRPVPTMVTSAVKQDILSFLLHLFSLCQICRETALRENYTPLRTSLRMRRGALPTFLARSRLCSCNCLPGLFSITSTTSDWNNLRIWNRSIPISERKYQEMKSL